MELLANVFDMSTHSFNWLAVVLVIICSYGVIEHSLALRESNRDIAAMIAAGRNGFLLKGVRGDALEELFRLIAKICLSIGYGMAVFSPGSILADLDARSVIVFVLQVAILGSLSASTHIRRQTRRALIRDTMIAKARKIDLLGEAVYHE